MTSASEKLERRRERKQRKASRFPKDSQTQQLMFKISHRFPLAEAPVSAKALEQNPFSSPAVLWGRIDHRVVPIIVGWVCWGGWNLPSPFPNKIPFKNRRTKERGGD